MRIVIAPRRSRRIYQSGAYNPTPRTKIQGRERDGHIGLSEKTVERRARLSRLIVFAVRPVPCRSRHNWIDIKARMGSIGRAFEGRSRQNCVGRRGYKANVHHRYRNLSSADWRAQHVIMGSICCIIVCDTAYSTSVLL